MITVTCLSACAVKHEQPLDTQQAFFNNIQSLCGKVFSGYSTFPDDTSHDFFGHLLVADFKSCQQDEVKIQFDVGENRSRTWIITDTDQGLLLKHDHRHEDGTPDDITNYGGWANDQGTAWQQHFEADEETAELIPDAATNVWMLDYDPNTQILTYDLKRHNQPRYQAQLRPVK